MIYRQELRLFLCENIRYFLKNNIRRGGDLNSRGEVPTSFPDSRRSRTEPPRQKVQAENSIPY